MLGACVLLCWSSYLEYWPVLEAYETERFLMPRLVMVEP